MNCEDITSIQIDAVLMSMLLVDSGALCRFLAGFSVFPRSFGGTPIRVWVIVRREVVRSSDSRFGYVWTVTFVVEEVFNPGWVFLQGREGL